MRGRLCWLLGHRVLLDYSRTVQPERGVFVGPIIRRCRDCSTILPGDTPEVGDRFRPGSEPPVMTYDERCVYLLGDE